ncbi:hypothetical protein [Thermomonas alba]|uniref:hypothetical protein n=1 Tax=Thermomonas alba TaxID=2888525 RepID=UPI001F036EDA|nr:hypothetical protein [Thermomonas alba]
MSCNTASIEQQLVDLLGSAASYNDKGVEWCGHSSGKVAEMQAEFHQGQLVLAQQIGAERLGQELLSAIESGAASRDWTGRYATLAEQVLGVRRSRA